MRVELPCGVHSASSCRIPAMLAVLVVVASLVAPAVGLAAAARSVPATKGFEPGAALLIQGDYGVVGGSANDAAVARVYLRRLKLHARGEIGPVMGYKLETALTGGSGAKAGSPKWGVTDAFVTLQFDEHLSLRIGRQQSAWSGESPAGALAARVIEAGYGSVTLSDRRLLGVTVLGKSRSQRFGFQLSAANMDPPGARGDAHYNLSGRLHGVWELPSGDSIAAATSWLLARDLRERRAGFDFDAEPGDLPDNLFVGLRRGFGVDARWTHARVEFDAALLRVFFWPLDRLPAPQVDARNWQATAAWFLRPGRTQLMLSRRVSSVGGSTRRNRAQWVSGINWWPAGGEVKVMLNYVSSTAPLASSPRGRWLARAQFAF